MRVRNIEQVIHHIENTTNRKLTNDEILLIGIGFDFGLVEGREQEKEKEDK
jgi:hypothetical protein